MKHNNLYIDIHVLQTVPPSCVNRDDTGSPKTAVYGGTTRARVSSQSWKRAMRQMFRQELLSDDVLGQRTKKIVGLVDAQIRALNPDLDAKASEKMAQNALKSAGLKITSTEKGTEALFFISHDQVKALAQLAVEDCQDNKVYKSALRENPSVDMVLFGRMVADDASLNYDAAAQVAHSISTHRVQNEFDYFTAVDDCAPEDSAGAGHLGTVEYNSATLYRYATVNVSELTEHLDPQTIPQLVGVFVDAFVRSMPTGKQNTFANRTLPDAVYVAVRQDQPVNLCGAFERAVPASDNGYVQASVRRFVDYTANLYKTYADAPTAAFAVGENMDSLAQTMSLKDLLSHVRTAVEQQLAGNEVE